MVKDLGADNVIAADLVDNDPNIKCKYEKLDICDQKKYESIVKENKVDYIVHLAAILSASGEKTPDLAYDVNVTGAQNAFNLSREYKTQLFIPSSIAAFGGDNF